MLSKGATSLLYKYNALGQKLTKEFGNAKTDYVNGIQYKDGAIEFIQTEEGRILPSNGSYIYEYFLEDHLGNTRAVVDHSGTIKQIQDYYPFGLEMNEGNALNTASNLYKYNGKEKQVEMGLDQLDYGARFYDAEIGRWNVIDPLAEKYLSTSPFSYVVNTPTNAIDPDGKQIIFRFFYSQEEKHVDLTYKNGAFYYAGGLKYDPTKGSISKTLDNLIDVFSKIEKSGNENLIGQLKTLETSKNKHIMHEGFNKGTGKDSNVEGNVKSSEKEGIPTGTKPFFNFFNQKSTYLKTPLTVFTHEMQHMYDFQIGNMKDNTGKGNVGNPAEIRTVHNENIIRKIYNIPLRDSYGGEKFDLNLLKNPPNLIYKSNNKIK